MFASNVVCFAIANRDSTISSFGSDSYIPTNVECPQLVDGGEGASRLDSDKK